ncbi:unnamed protein product [Clonostachys byssicola]|uniref:NACHT domain-containing protein n=1 Tax=Clonostachys byssicola TaxID=160290 RepID=A0A9N9XZH0_9HYPO|nr:unnamed protein product [Clonostachys byssicola]
MAQLMIRPRNDSVIERGLYSKIEKLLSKSEGKSDATIKSTFLDTIWPELEQDYRLMVGNLIIYCEHEIQQRGISAKVDGRVKASSSINKTLHRREQHRMSKGLGVYERVEDMFRDMHDLAGLRIIVDYPSQLERANQLVLECFHQENKPNVFTRDRPVGQSWDAWFGAYESCNHHVTLDTRATGILQVYRHVVFEIQLTSLPESLYNKLAHPLLYKQKSGKMSRQDEMVIDLSHGLSLCYSICLLYMQDKLDDHDKQADQQELRNAMRNAVSGPDTQGEGDKDEDQLTDGMGPLVGMIPDMVRRQIPNLSSKSNGKTVSTELFTGILSALPEACDSPESIWSSIITRLTNWDARIGAVEAAMEKQTKAIEKAQNTSQSEADKKCLTDLRVINPSHHKKAVQKAKGGLLKDAYRWVLHHEDYLRFRNNPDNRLLWIKGDPGKGKTMLLCGIIDELLSEDRESISFFFCEATQSDQKRNATAVLRSLIWLLCTDQPHLVSYIRERYDSEGKDLFEDETTAFPALEEILIDMLHDSNCRDSIFIIDALDESSDNTRSDLINLIIQLSDSIHNAK